MLYLIGIGLGNEKDITLNALDVIKKCDLIYLEGYTSNLGFAIKDMEKLIDRDVVLVDRLFVENDEDLVDSASERDIALLIKGDVFSATTHSALFLRCKEKDVECRVLHNASILTAVGDTGLSLYKFGKVASIPFDNKGIRTPFEVYLVNKNCKMHTLFLLDLDPKNNRFMNFKDGLNYLNENGDESVNLETYVVVCAGIGTDKGIIKYGKIVDLLKLDIDIYPQCFIIPGELHFIEEDLLNKFII